MTTFDSLSTKENTNKLYKIIKTVQVLLKIDVIQF